MKVFKLDKNRGIVLVGNTEKELEISAEISEPSLYFLAIVEGDYNQPKFGAARFYDKTKDKLFPSEFAKQMFEHALKDYE